MFAQVIKFQSHFHAINAGSLIKTRFDDGWNSILEFLFALSKKRHDLWMWFAIKKMRQIHPFIASSWNSFRSRKVWTNRTSEAGAAKHLKQQGMNAEFNSLCESYNSTIYVWTWCSFADPTQSRPCVHSIKVLGRCLPCDACNTIVSLFFRCQWPFLLCRFHSFKWLQPERDTQMNNAFPTPPKEP